MKKKILTIISIVVLSFSLLALLFPLISNLIYRGNTNSIVNKFDTKDNIIVDIKGEDDKSLTLDEAIKQKESDDKGYLLDKSGDRVSDTPVIFKVELDRLYKDSLDYNNDLVVSQRSKLLKTENYRDSALVLSDYGIFDGVYGYISAEKIDMKLPILLGATKDNMAIGAAHLNNTSLPIGGKNTNCVLAGHTGYIGRTFFDNLPELEKGDKITIKTYFNTLTYEVVKSTIKKPKDSNLIFIEEGKDMLTLLTCTPGDDGTFDRYCLICERADK